MWTHRTHHVKKKKVTKAMLSGKRCSQFTSLVFLIYIWQAFRYRFRERAATPQKRTLTVHRKTQMAFKYPERFPSHSYKGNTNKNYTTVWFLTCYVFLSEGPVLSAISWPLLGLACLKWPQEPFYPWNGYNPTVNKVESFIWKSMTLASRLPSHGIKPLHK